MADSLIAWSLPMVASFTKVFTSVTGGAPGKGFDTGVVGGRLCGLFCFFVASGL
jgi:hypothetical protein